MITEPTHTSGRLLTTDEVAERLRVHRSSVYRMVYAGRLGAVQIARRGRGALRIPEGELEAFIYGPADSRSTPLHDKKELAK